MVNFGAFAESHARSFQRMEEIKNSTDLEEKSAFLTYLLAQKSLTPEEANSHAVDLMMGAVETVSTTPFDRVINMKV